MHALARLRDEARALTLREAIREIGGAYRRNEVLTYASAIAFQVFFALIPLALFALGLLGGLGLDGVWTEEIAPDIRRDMSPAAFQVVDETVRNVLGERQVFWMTAGAVIAVWKMSCAGRGVMDAFDRIYGSVRERPLKERLAVSIALSIACGTLVLLAVAVFQLGPLLLGGPLAVARWPVGIALLIVAVGLLVHFAPATERPAEWVTFGTLLVVVAWIGTSVLFTAYLTGVADYGSIFGALATFIVTFEYLYLATAAFLTGAQLDALIRERSERTRGGQDRPATAVGAPAAA